MRVMKNTAFARNNVFIFAVLIPTSAVLGMYAYLGTYIRMVADDFCSAHFAERLGLLRSIWYWYKNWSGRYTAFGIDWLMDKIGFQILPAVPALVLLVWVVLTITAIQLYLRSVVSHNKAIVMASALATVFIFVVLLLSPSIEQSLYWWNGMRSYGLPLILLTCYLVLLQIGVKRLTNRKQIIAGSLLSFLFIFLNGGLGETYVAFQVIFLGFLLLLAWLVYKNEMAARFWFLLSGLFGALLALVMVVASPGNVIRQAFFPPHPNLIKLSQISMQSYLDFLLGILRTPEKISGLLGAVLLAFLLGVQSGNKSIKNHWLILLVCIGAFAISFACFVPGAYATSEPSPARTIIIPAFILVACLLWAGFSMGQQFGYEGQSSKLIVRVLPILVVLLIVYSVLINFQNLYTSRNIYSSFAQRWEQANALILQTRATGAKSVTIPALHVFTGPGGDPTDNPKYWVNECYSLYYGITVLGPNPDAPTP